MKWLDLPPHSMMAGLVSSVGLVVTLKARMHGRGLCAVFLGMMAVVTVIAADSPVAADEPWMDSNKGFLENVPKSTETSPSALAATHTIAFGNPDSPSVLTSIPAPNHNARTADIKLFHWGNVSSPNSKSFTPSDRLAGGPQLLSTPPLSPIEPVLVSSPQFEVPAKLSRDWKLARTKSDQQSSSHTQPPTGSQLQPQLNISIASSSPSAFTRSTTPELGALDASPRPDHSLLDPNLPLQTSSKIVDLKQLSMSSAPVQQNNQAHEIDLQLNPAEILAPSYVPFMSPHPTSPSSKPTEVFPDEFFPTDTMDVDWGSGDYLETMSYFSSEGDDYSLVTKLPSDMYDLEDSTESYDTSFPSRVGVSLSSMQPLHVSPSPSLLTAYTTIVPLTSIHPSSFSSKIHDTLEPTSTAHSDTAEASDIDWSETFSIEPTDVLLPDMNSLEYYTTQLTKENTTSDTGAEHKGNATTSREFPLVSINATHITPTLSFTVHPSHMLTVAYGSEEHQPTNYTRWTEEESSSDVSGFEPNNETTPVHATEEMVNTSETLVHPSIEPTPLLHPSSSSWDVQVSTRDSSASSITVGLDTIALTVATLSSATTLLTDDVILSSSLTDVYWFVTESILHTTIHTTPILTATTAFSPFPGEPAANTTPGATEITPTVTTISTEPTHNITSGSTEPPPNVTFAPPVMVNDQGVNEVGNNISATATLTPASTEANTTSAVSTTTTAATTSQATNRITTTTTSASSISTTSSKMPTVAPTSRQYLCNLNNPAYLVKIGFPSGATVGYAKSQVRDILKGEFNKSVELQVVDPPPKFVFRAVSGPVVYTAISVINSLRRSGRRFLSVSPTWMLPDRKYQIHTVLQFVPTHIDVRVCNFSESVERGLTMAFAEVRRRSKESTNFTVHIVNITMTVPKYQGQRLPREPVDITFTVRGARGYLMGSEVSNALMKLTMVEFSYYMGFPVLQIAEPFHYPELNTTQLLRSSWVRTVLLGVLDQRVGERTFQAKMERRVAMLLGEALGSVRRVKRATIVGNNSVQVVSVNQMVGVDHPLEMVYFVEGPSGQRLPAGETANLLNSLDVQRAAIVLGYRVQGILAQPLDKEGTSPADNENTNTWIIIGVVIPLLVVIVIISILYWKLCRTDKLEFQPDAMTSIQQRQKSTASFSESKTPLPQTLPATEKVIQFSEEEEEECEEECEEEEEYDEEEEEEEQDVKAGKKLIALTKGKQSMSSGEEEEEEDEEEDEEEEQEEDKDEQREKMKKNGMIPEEKRGHWQKAMLKKTGEMKKEEKMKMLSKERKAKEKLQAPSVKGFDFAKLHLGQHNKDDVTVIQEPGPPGPGPGPLPTPVKDGLSPPENGEIPTPTSKTSSTKASRSERRRGRISPSERDSVVSDHSTERESTEENLRAHATPNDSKQTRPPPMNGTNEQLSSASIFEHVDRMSRATDASRRLPNKIQLIAMQPMPFPPLHSPTANGKLTDTNHINSEIQIALRHKSEIEHHRNKIRLRAKRKGHYDFPAMDDTTSSIRDTKDQDRIYQKAQMQIDKILDPDSHMPSILMEPKKSGRGRRSPRQRRKDQLNGGMMDADKDHLITEDADASYRKCPGVNNVAYVSDPDQGPGSPHRSPSPTDDVFLGPTSSPPCHAPPPPPYMPPQPSIEEARQQMHSLLDDAFALVSPTSQGSTAGITLPGVNTKPAGSSPPGRDHRPWAPSYLALSPFPGRFNELSMSPPSGQGLPPRQGLGSSYLSPGETAGPGDQLQPESLYSNRGLYTDELSSSARPRPVGGTTGAQFHHLTQVGLSSRLNGCTAGVRAAPGQNGGIGWNHYHENNFSRAAPEKDEFLDFPDYSSSSVFQTPRSALREPSAPPPHVDAPGLGYLPAPEPLDTSPPTHSSASLIKAIREELLRLSQKQAAVSGYHS